MYSYQQSTGELRDASGALVGTGYSGHGSGLNNPNAETIRGVGPLPQGKYTIGPAIHDPKLGPIVMHLNPDPANQMYGRSAFFMHGDNAQENHTGSEGCIVMARSIREQVADSTDRDLEVIA